MKDLIPSVDDFLPPTTPENRYVWSRSLTKMRQQMISDSDFRICAGGRHSGYKGIMPGLLEEILIALEMKKPVFLLGGFGGVSASVCNLIMTGSAPEELTEEWQILHTGGYKNLLDFANQRDSNYRPDYSKITEFIKNADLNNGLSEKENEILFQTPFVDVAIILILTGFGRKMK